uniref:Putative exonuclease n=1 Tax=viral metagenome TaxID=1070528 RepID=A0A6M3LRC5_9ZZZZ
MAQVLGLDKYNTVIRLFHEKLGTIEPRQIDNQKMFFGRYMEDSIADIWSYYDGTSDGYIENFKNKKIIRECRKVNGYVVNPSYPWLFASLDRVQNIKGGINLLTGEPLKTEAVMECKTLSYWSSQMWTDGIPISYLIQIHQYMIILETDYAEIAILKDGNDFSVEKIQRDDSLCEKIIEISKGFWYNRVLPAKEAFAKRQEAEKAGNIGEVEKYDALIQKYEPEPDATEAYTDFMNERFLRERDSIDGTMELFDLCKRDKVLNGIKGLIDDARTGIKNILVKALTQAGAEQIDFGRLGTVAWSERKGAKNRTFNNRIKEKPTEDQLMAEFDKINQDCY